MLQLFITETVRNQRSKIESGHHQESVVRIVNLEGNSLVPTAEENKI